MTDPAPRAKVGVLFVHGVGEQKQGDTLMQCVDPLAEWISGWAAADKHEPVVRGTRLRTADGEPAHAS